MKQEIGTAGMISSVFRNRTELSERCPLVCSVVLCLDLCIGLCVDPVNDNLMMIQPNVIHSNWVVILEMNSKSRMNKKVERCIGWKNTRKGVMMLQTCYVIVCVAPIHHSSSSLQLSLGSRATDRSRVADIVPAKITFPKGVCHFGSSKGRTGP